MNTEKLKNLCLEALETDGAHHKQWYLEKILEELGYDLLELEETEKLRRKGIAP